MLGGTLSSTRWTSTFAVKLIYIEGGEVLCERRLSKDGCDSDETVAEVNVVVSDSASKSISEMSAPSIVDPMPLRHWVRRWLASVFEVVAVLPDVGKHDAACDVPHQDDAAAVSFPSCLEWQVEAKEHLVPLDRAGEEVAPLSENEGP